MSKSDSDTQEAKNKLRRKNMAVGGIVIGLCVLFFLITIVRMQ